jgi:hypothetical protein
MRPSNAEGRTPADAGCGPRRFEQLGGRLDRKIAKASRATQEAHERVSAAAAIINHRQRLKGARRVRWAVEDAP